MQPLRAKISRSVPVGPLRADYRGGVDTWRDRMRDRRKKKGLTQTQLAEILGVEQSTIAGWEGGRREPETLKMFEALARALDCHPATLLYDIPHLEDGWTADEWKAAEAFIETLRTRAS